MRRILLATLLAAVAPLMADLKAHAAGTDAPGTVAAGPETGAESGADTPPASAADPTADDATVAAPDTTAPPPPSATPETKRGPVTNLPLPRYVSLKTGEGNVRRGPSLTHRIDWVFTRRDMPLQITGEYGHWRRVRDRDGAGGWMHYALLSGVRTVIVEEDLTPLRAQPFAEGQVRAYAEAGVVAQLDECRIDWCRIEADGNAGWVPKTTVWGVDPWELRE
ncbi:SH3-like domain-containing protein [Brevirhabdus pacifica]|uniref:SH3 domain-containing protein n=2 Tax=Brevirhabdus pacifica TaxID=1267768 RepID=UPI0009F92486|nr:SH3 domain-containing protein [Brevirhabdus pacifica]PJJ80808.1 SH3-like domain-containing protein [Brevirhabdus pacifica]